MSRQNGGGGLPVQESAADEITTATQQIADQEQPTRAARRRAAAARALPPLRWRTGCRGHALRRRDPLIPPVHGSTSSTFSLSDRELRAEADRLVRMGWDPAEVMAVLAVRRRVIRGCA
jgi:hypothetical protein